jgi:hypothetical protein
LVSTKNGVVGTFDVESSVSTNGGVIRACNVVVESNLANKGGV